MKKTYLCGASMLLGSAICAPLAAQDVPNIDTATTIPDIDEVDGPPGFGPTVFDGDWVSIGIGAAYSPSYTGSDDYVISVLPIVQGSVSGIDINPRPGGLALDFISDVAGKTSFDFGIAARIRSDRVNNIEDEVVGLLDDLDLAVEVGPTAGVSFPAVLNPFDSLSINVDARWDVAGAHSGMVIDPSITYFTPLSRAIITSLTLGAAYADSDFNDYYFSIDPAAAASTGLPQYDADGGFNSVNATLLAGYDLSGDATDGGLALVTIAGYSRLLGDAKNTPFTSIRGDADQFFVAVGIGYTF